MFEGPDTELMKTEFTQPAILTASVCCWQVLKEEGVTPDVAAGHSLGEYSALVAAGSISFSDAVHTVNLRGKFMQEAVPLGEGSKEGNHVECKRAFPFFTYGTGGAEAEEGA